MVWGLVTYVIKGLTAMYAWLIATTFVSCERVFRPDLNGKPVIVLSNNDGCPWLCSNEAKALGIKMGVPLKYAIW